MTYNRNFHFYMLADADLRELHVELQKVFGCHPVILGGSYFWNEANEDSDVDFNVAVNWRDRWRYKKFVPAVKKLKEKYATAVGVAIVAPLTWSQGWFFVAGRNVEGKFISNNPDRKNTIRSSIKCAYYKYLLYQLGAKEQKQYLLTKAAQHFAVAKFLFGGGAVEKNSFSYQSLISFLEKNGEDKVAVKLLRAKLNKQIFPQEVWEQYAGELRADLEKLFGRAGRWFGFSPFNYLIYNLKFLRRGCWDFLWANPDKKIIEQLRAGLTNGGNLLKLQAEMSKIIFPIIII